MPEHEDSLGGETFSGEAQQDPAEQSLGDGATMGGDTAGHSLGDQSTFGDANVDDELFDDAMKLEDLSERYTEEGVLGKGGMGEVILATDTRLGRKVAIKRILGKAARSKTAVARFLTEAKSMAELSHPNIVQIYDYGRATDGPFLIMECVQGGSLLEKCKAGPIELDEAVNIFGQLCDGLAKAHASNIIHRDIKPANVLMTEDGIPKLTDFGLAKDDTADTGMTMEGAVIGTLDFMPPEQRQAVELTDHRSDLWSLAATFYQMLTGKSPKIIRFSDVPTQLQDPLGKALEESKEDRFQSALKMKEAVLQAATVGLNASRDLGEGECPSCGTTNPSDRKFCRNGDCATSLEVDCLGCKTAIPMWEAVCGSCGTKQDSLIEEAKERLQSKHNEAEVLLNELKFDDALRAASVIGQQNDSRLQQFSAWHEEFSSRLESSRTSEHSRLEELLREAHAHEQAYDYASGLQTLEQVARSLNQTIVSGSEDTAEKITKRLTTKQSRLRELEEIVRRRFIKSEFSGLLQFVEELLTLKPERLEVEKLRVHLEKRDAELLVVRDNAYLKATQELAGQQYAKAIATLNAVPEEVCDAQLLELKTKASDSQSRLNHLRDRITMAVSNDQLKDLLPVVEECLTLKADQGDFLKLRQELMAREAQIDARNQQIIALALQHMQQLQFNEAVQILGTIVPENQTVTTTGLIQQAHQLSMHRQGVLSAVPVALSNKKYQIAIKSISQYLGEIANTGIQDPQIQQMLEEAKGKQSVSIHNKKLVKLGIAVASVVVVLIIGAVINNYIDVKAVETAIANLDWEAALEIDPDNSEGLRMQAAVKKAAAVTSALAEGDWIAVLSLDPDNREGLRMQAAAEKAAAVTSALAAGDWIAVLSLDPDNREGLRMQAAAKKAAAVTSALAAGDWIAVLSLDPDNSEGLRMQAAVKKAVAVSAALAKGDWKAVLAIDPNNREGLRLQVAEEKTAAENAVKVDAALAKGDWKTALALDADNREGLRLKDAAVTAALAKGDWTVVLSLDPNNSDGLRMQAAAEKAAILAGDPITNTILMTFNNIPSGTFMMGSPQTEKDRQDDEQQHKVRITKPFYMQTTEVTQGQWKALMDTEPWKGRGDVKEGANYPATWISRDNAVAYCEKLSEKERKRYRLPTEAEWEYACRARTETRWSFGNDENELGDYAWWLKNAIDQGEKYAHQVGLKKPNAFGLYDMHGNVWEWCQDYYGEDYYKQSTEKDPRGQPQGSLRVLRGGSWGGSASDARSAFRGRNEAGSHNLYDGFRLVRELD